MANFAKLGEDNIVLEVIVIDNINNADPRTLIEDENLGIAYLQRLTGHATWKQCSYNNNFRKQFAGRGMTYNSSLNMFIHPKPFPSWILDSNGDWQPPVARPIDFTPVNRGGNYIWNENNQRWDSNPNWTPYTS
jgi:hypothetical protein